jgi:hypothetical protein
MMRVEHDYRRGGALAYLAAWDVHRGRVTGRCEATTGIEPFTRLVDQVMSIARNNSADRGLCRRVEGDSTRGQDCTQVVCRATAGLKASSRSKRPSSRPSKIRVPSLGNIERFIPVSPTVTISHPWGT